MKWGGVAVSSLLVSLASCWGPTAALAGIRTDLERTLVPTNLVAGSVLGGSIAAYGDVAVAGVPLADPDAAFDAGAACVFSRNAGGTDAWHQVATLLAADRAAGDRFGQSVALHGDVAIVGAYSANPGGSNDAGAAYVFMRHAGGTNAWGQVAKLTAADKQAGDQFGYAVALDGDVAAIGAYTADPGGLNSAGAVYVFQRAAGNSTNWPQIAKLTASDKGANDQFGKAVAIEGEVIVVGALEEDPGDLNNAGSAYLFIRNAGGTNAWGQVAKLVAADAAAGDRFGSAVDVAGDIVLVGASVADVAGVTNAGAAYAFRRNEGGLDAWGQCAKLIASDGAADDEFGVAVAVDDGVALVGAHADDAGTRTNAGAAYVFEQHAGGANAWGQVGKLSGSQATNNGYFGRAVALDAHALLVGAQQGAASPSGLVCRVTVEAEDWTRVQDPWVDESSVRYFGSSVSMDGDVLAVGAPGFSDAGTTNCGTVFVYDRDADRRGSWIRRAILRPQDLMDNDQFGYRLAVGGDVLAVASLKDDGTNADVGAVYVYERHAGGTNAWGEVARLRPPDATGDSEFGRALAVTRDTIVVATPWNDSGYGAVNVYGRDKGGTSAWGRVQTLWPSDTANWTPYRVAMAGDVIVVGAPTTDLAGHTAAGVADVFERSPGSTSEWAAVARLVDVVPDFYGYFAFRVAVDGNRIAVLAPSHQRVCLYERAAISTGRWERIAELNASQVDGASSSFGAWALEVAGDVVAVGDEPATQQGVTNGAVYLFGRNVGGVNQWGPIAKLAPSDFADHTIEVALTPNSLAVGCTWDDARSTNQGGACYVFEGSLFGPPAITKMEEKSGDWLLNFTSQPAWRYDLEATTNAAANAWAPIPGETNLPGALNGLSARGVDRTDPARLFRVKRKTP